MNKQDIANIHLGAKQIPLGFEKDPAQEQNVVASCVRDYAEQHGEVVFHRFVEYVKERHGYALADILQLIFWLASDQEIRFRANGKAFSPHEVKKMLLESPDAEVFLIFHQPVEDVVLEKVQYFYAQLTGRQAPLILSDPHDLSRLLAKQIRYWTDCLNACRHGVEKPGYPGKKILADGLFLINKISARLDPFSLIYAFYENQEEILKLSEEVKILYGFYLRHGKTWETLIRDVGAFNNEGPELSRSPEAVKDLERLNQIVESEQPYALLEEAEQVVKRIRPHHSQLVEEKTAAHRQDAEARSGQLIEKIARIAGENRTAKDQRRQALQNLRSIAKKIQLATDISAINQLSGEAEDQYEVFMEEIQNTSP